MTQISRRKFSAEQLVIVNETVGDTTSYLATALTLSLSLDRERDQKWTGKRN
jgi:hypothetical protein